jgi:hypothetical protein
MFKINPTQASVPDTILCDKVCQWLATGWGFSPVLQFPLPNETDRHDITENIVESGIKHHNPNPHPV